MSNEKNYLIEGIEKKVADYPYYKDAPVSRLNEAITEMNDLIRELRKIDRKGELTNQERKTIPKGFRFIERLKRFAK